MKAITTILSAFLIVATGFAKEREISTFNLSSQPFEAKVEHLSHYLELSGMQQHDLRAINQTFIQAQNRIHNQAASLSPEQLQEQIINALNINLSQMKKHYHPISIRNM